MWADHHADVGADAKPIPEYINPSHTRLRRCYKVKSPGSDKHLLCPH